MKRTIFALVVLLCQTLTYLAAQPTTNAQTAKKILADTRLDTVQQKGLVLFTGFSAGTSYNEVWIRDFNTFIKGSLKVQSPKAVRDMLLLFFKSRARTATL